MEADNCGKNHYSNPVQTQETVYELLRSREMKPLLKQMLKDRLPKTRQSARNKESRTLGLEAIGKLCKHGRIIYYSSK